MRTIAPLKISERAHTASTDINAPSAEHKENIMLNKPFFLFPVRYVNAVSPQKYQPIIVQKANMPIDTVRNNDVLSPSMCEIASDMDMQPPSEAVSRVNAVRVQQTIVSKNTSNTLHMP